MLSQNVNHCHIYIELQELLLDIFNLSDFLETFSEKIRGLNI